MWANALTTVGVLMTQGYMAAAGLISKDEVGCSYSDAYATLKVARMFHLIASLCRVPDTNKQVNRPRPTVGPDVHSIPVAITCHSAV